MRSKTWWYELRGQPVVVQYARLGQTLTEFGEFTGEGTRDSIEFKPVKGSLRYLSSGCLKAVSQLDSEDDDETSETYP